MQGIRRMFDVLFVLLGITVTAFAQDEHLMHSQGIQLFDHYTNLHQSNQLNDTVYMGMVDSLAALSLDKGKYYSISEMPDNLKQYEKIAWSKKEYRSYRIDYFTILLNNAYLSGKWGASIFYAEKVARQSEKEDMYRPFIEPGVKMYIYSLTNQKDKQIETYQKHKQQIQDLSVKIKKEPEVYYWDGMDALRILSPIINTYFHRKDTLKGEEAYKLASSLIQGIEKDSTTSNSSRQITKFYTIAFDFFKASGLERKNDVKAALNKLEALLKKGDIIGDEYAYNLLDWKANYFLEIKQVDSAAFYIGKLEKTVDFSQDQQIRINRYKSQLELLRGNPERSHELLNKALEESFKMQAELSAEMDNLLYAYTEAEHHRLAFLKSKKEKNFIIITVSVCALLVIIITYTLLHLKNLKLKRVVSKLNETADIQIALMEQFESKVRKEEQQRISQDLHDDLAGTLVAIKNNIDITISETLDETEREGLSKVSAMVESAFGYVRSKSHEIFKKTQMPDEEMFQQHILQLVQVAFPSQYYNLNVQIDDYALKSISIELRANLIRIIQEAFTNIIKHAKATKVDLLIYRENDGLVIFIKDNGIGFKENKQQNLGLQSVQNRLEKFNAKFSLTSSNEDGAEVVITIPNEHLAPL